MATTTKQDRVRELQRALYRAAKAEPERRFHALYDKVHRRDVLERAWEAVRANRGAAGTDRITLADVERYGIDRLLDELAMDLRDGRWRPLPARRVFIPKPGREELRPLSIPAVRDRIVQAAVKAVIEPIFEADFVECSFGFRPKRSAHDALQVLIDESWRGRRWVAETDIASCFEAIPHDQLVAAIEERICDRRLLKLLRALLRAGVMEQGALRRGVIGTPQGGVVTAPTQLATWRSVAARRGDRVTDGDIVLLAADEDFAHDEAQDALLLVHGQLVEAVGEAGEEAFERLGELEVGLGVVQFGFEGAELRGERGLALAQLGHPLAQLLERDQLLLVGLD